MKANVLYHINDLQLTEVGKPVLRSGEVLVKVRACGICGSDIARVFTTGTYHFPTIIGHEFAGEVVEAFSPADSSLIGKRVAVYPLIPCGACESCKHQAYELCESYSYLGSRCDGGCAELVAVPKWNAFPIPEKLPFEAAAMMEPAAVALHALRMSNFEAGKNMAILGPGTIGMILAMLARIYGANKVILIGRSQQKLDFAQKLGIENTINSTTENVAEKISYFTANQGVHLVVEGTGASASMEMALDMVKHSGTICAMGNPLCDLKIAKNTWWKLLRKQLKICGTWNSRYGTPDSDWEKIANLMLTKLDVAQLITHRLHLTQLLEGLNLMKNNNIYTNKVMLLSDELSSDE
jgi:L-iditol 2-dehydrogenase